MQGVEFRKQDDALLIVRIGARNDRDTGFRLAQIVRQVRNIRRHIKEVAGAGDNMMLKPFAILAACRT